MKRQTLHVADDILMEELIAMARNAGFHIRISCGLVCMDRVPNIVRKDRPNLIVIERKVK
jgi:hypothetical protein